jgi:Spy/CpxP family protein refolding chaperone
MRLIYRVILLLFCTLSIGMWAQMPATKSRSQHKTEPVPMPLNRPVNADDHLHMLSEQLNLTKAQQAKIRPILEKYLRQRQEIELNDKFSPDEKSARLQASQNSSYSRIRTLLTVPQKKKFNDIMGTDDETPQHPSTAKKK